MAEHLESLLAIGRRDLDKLGVADMGIRGFVVQPFLTHVLVATSSCCQIRPRKIAEREFCDDA